MAERLPLADRLLDWMFPGRRQQREYAEIVGAYRDVFTSPQGETVLRHLLQVCGVFRPTYVRGDQIDTVHSEGRRDVALGILNMLGKDPDQVLEMLEQQETLDAHQDQ